MPELLLPAFADPEQVRKVRLGGIGASEIAAVVELSPWLDEFTLWHRKRGLADDVDSDAMRWGRRLESAVADEFSEIHPELSVMPAGVYAHPDRPWQIASPDRLLYESGAALRDVPERPASLLADPISVLEIKTAGSWDGWGDERSDDIPVYYRCQVLWQMDVMGVAEARVAVLVGGRHYREYTVTRDQDDIDVLVAAGERFWKIVQAGDEPSVGWLPSTARALKTLHPTVVDSDVEIPERLARAYRQARAHEDRIGRHVDLLTNQIRHRMGEAKRAVCGGQRVAARSVYERRGIDVKRLREEEPDVARRFTRTSTVDKLVAAPAPKATLKTIREALA